MYIQSLHVSLCNFLRDIDTCNPLRVLKRNTYRYFTLIFSRSLFYCCWLCENHIHIPPFMKPCCVCVWCVKNNERWKKVYLGVEKWERKGCPAFWWKQSNENRELGSIKYLRIEQNTPQEKQSKEKTRVPILSRQ